MAVAPIFIADTLTLKSQLRLTGAAQGDAIAVIDSGIQEAGLYIRRVLGNAKVVALQVIGYVDNPTTDDQVKRLKANKAELALTRIYLMRSMPILFMDASGSKREDWNQEGFTRRVGMRDLQAEIDRLQTDVDIWLAELAADDGIVAGAIQSATLCVPVGCSPIPITRSIQGGFNSRDLEFRGGVF